MAKHAKECDPNECSCSGCKHGTHGTVEGIKQHCFNHDDGCHYGCR